MNTLALTDSNSRYINTDKIYKNPTRHNFCSAKKCNNKSNHIRLKISIGMLLVVFLFMTTLINTTAKNSTAYVEKQYKSVLIDEGDTIWDIASENNDEALSCLSTDDYIKYIEDINNIDTDNITAGSYIIVPVYSAK